MKNYTIKTLLASFALSFALSARAALPAGDPVFKAMKDELSRSMAKLQMGDLQKPYALSYEVLEGQALSVSASFAPSNRCMPRRTAA